MSDAGRIAKCVQIAAQLEDARTVARQLFGGDYAAKVEPWRDAVLLLARDWSCSAVQVPLRLQELGKFPSSPLLLFAGVVEAVESQSR